MIKSTTKSIEPDDKNSMKLPTEAAIAITNLVPPKVCRELDDELGHEQGQTRLYMLRAIRAGKMRINVYNPIVEGIQKNIKALVKNGVLSQQFVASLRKIK